MAIFTCIASRDDGTRCRAPASILDHQHGGMVCLQHVPAAVANEVTLYLTLGLQAAHLHHEGEVYTWRLEPGEEAPTC